MTKELDIENCRECEESRCIMSKCYGLDFKGIEEAKEEAIYFKIAKRKHNERIKTDYIEQTTFWKRMLVREDEATNYDRMNAEDYRHQKKWDLIILKLMELQEQYYSNIKY